MKKITTLLVACFFAGGIFAQQASITELLERLEQNHMGSITDVFSSEELSRIRQHFQLVPTDANTTEVTNNPLIHTTENVNVNYSVIDPDDVSMVELIAPSPLAEFEGAGATVPGTKDAIVVDNNNNVYGVSPDGSYISLGQLMPTAGQSFTGLEFTSDGRLFGIASDGTGTTTLYEIDGLSLALTTIGETGLVVGISLGRDSNNELYALDIDTNMVHRINKTTGAGTVLGPVGFNASFGQGMGFDPVSEMLVCTCFNNTIVDSELRTINTTTGASTLIGEIVPPTTMQFGWMSVFDPKLGVNESILHNISIAPNPAKDVLLVSGELTINALKIYSVLGQLVLEQKPNINSLELNISNLETGTYFISIEAAGERGIFKFIKQ